MADLMDEVQRWNELHTEVSLKNQSIKVMPEQHPDFDGQHCVDCADPVEPERLTWGRIRCAGCQDLKEREDAARARNGRAE